MGKSPGGKKCRVVLSRRILLQPDWLGRVRTAPSTHTLMDFEPTGSAATRWVVVAPSLMSVALLASATWPASVSRDPLSMRREWGRPAPLVASVPHPKRVSVPKASPKAGPTAASPKAGHPRDTGLTQCGTHASMPHPMWDARLGASPNLTLLHAASPNAGQIRPLPHESGINSPMSPQPNRRCLPSQVLQHCERL